MTSIDGFDHPLAGRYASEEMLRLFSPRNRYRTWRRMWLALAEAEAELGLEIPAEALEQMRENLDPDEEDFEGARRYEKEFRHDVMAHLHAFADRAPAARPILHLGATSCFVGDNAELLLSAEALRLIETRLISVLGALGKFARKWASLPTLGHTHFQPAQPTTVGKRACLWAQDFLLDLERLRFEAENLRARGVKGTTGTQASFLDLFGGDSERVRRLDTLVSEKLGFPSSYAVTGQTYPRKIDSFLLNTLSGIAQSASKMATDIRLLARLKEIREPLASGQIGSSAMPYKANPMRSERVCALSRWMIAMAANPAMTAATQWLERSLDDSANRRMALPEAFLCTDAILRIIENLARGLVVFPAICHANLMAELPFMASEAILMEAVSRGAGRQEIHERLRQHARTAADRMLQGGDSNPFLELAASDPRIPLSAEELKSLLDPEHFCGRAAEQVAEFLRDEIEPILEAFPTSISDEGGDLEI